MSVPNSQAPAHWSKDFVEHLRTVHFALIAISAGLILLVLSSKEYNAINALVELQEIINLKQQWSPKWVLKQAQNSGSIDIGISPLRSKALGLGGDPAMMDGDRLWPIFENSTEINGMLKWQGKSLALRCRYPKDNWSQSGSDESGTFWSPNNFPATLTQFRGLWSLLGHGYEIYLPEELYERWIVGGVGVAEFRPGLNDDMLSKTKNVDLRIMMGYLSATGPSPNPVYAYYQAETKDIAGTTQLLTIPITRIGKFVLSQNAVSKMFRGINPGPFERSFKDLSVAARDEADVSLETIKDFLHDEAAKGPEVFEAFGMKFPAGQITFWGVILLLSIQLYFLVYLQRLFGKLKPDDAGWDVPWIGMDSSQLSKTILYVSLVVLPCIAAILLAWQATVRLASGYWERTEHWYHPVHFLAWPWHWHYTVLLKIFLLLLAAIASGYLGLQSWKYRPQIAPEAPSCPAQSFE